MFKLTTYLASMMLITSIVTSINKSGMVFAQSMGSAASSLSTTSLPVLGQATTVEQVSTSYTTPSGQMLTNTITKTTVLDPNGNAKTTITGVDPSLLGTQPILPTIPGMTTIPAGITQIKISDVISPTAIFK